MVGGLGGVGLLKVAALNGRASELTQLRRAVAALRAYVAHTRAPAAQAFRAAARACGGLVARALEDAARLVASRQGLSGGAAWMQAYSRYRSRSCLTEEDRALLEELCVLFGRVDGETQLASIDQALTRLQRAEEEADQERDRMGRLLGFSGVAAGLGLAIWLL